MKSDIVINYWVVGFCVFREGGTKSDKRQKS
jgi:hypothetical protein